jgi:hypothetical protein
MTRKPSTGFPVDEIRGRLLHEALLDSARSSVLSQDWDVETAQAPDFPTIGHTDSGTMRAVVVAS